MLKKEEHLYQ